MLIRGQIKKIKYQNENDWCRCVFENMGETFNVAGRIENASVGMIVDFDGHEKNDQYGKYYDIDQVINIEFDDLQGARMFLAGGFMKGIGVLKANAILDIYGIKGVDMFETEEGRKELALTVKGLGAKSVEKAYESYLENRHYKDLVLFLNGMATICQIEKIYSNYKESSIKILKKNPYRLILDLPGFGFKKVDKLALASGIKKNSPYRIMAAAKYCLETAQTSEGHCFLTIEELKDRVLPLLEPDPKCKTQYLDETRVKKFLADWKYLREKTIEDINPDMEDITAIDEVYNTRELIKENLSDALIKAIEENTLVNEDGNIYTKEMYDLECNIAKMLHAKISGKSARFVSKEVIEASIKDVEQRKTEDLKAQGKYIEFKITEEQRKAVYTSLMNSISIISGGPGRGKTAISEIVAKAFLSAGNQYDEKDILMLAPTGRAAQRITESTGYEAMTAHRAVMSMKKDVNDRPKNKLILVDETSMVDIFLMNDILKYARDCNIVFVGDVDQIASVGPGKILKDMIDSGKIPCILLKEGHRNSGTIAKNAELINAGLPLDRYFMDEHFHYEGVMHYRDYNDKSRDEDLRNEFNNNITNLILNDYVRKVNEYGIKDVMLCTAMRERGPVCVNRLNSMLQDIYTKGHKEATYGKLKFRVGDRVMQTKNDYNFVKKIKDNYVSGVFNGEKGSIARIDYDEDNESFKMTVLFDDGSYGGYTKNTAQNLTLAYATTLHKCQGSEAACMMMAYTYSDHVLLNKALFYTGETRAKKEFRFYGEEQIRNNKVLSAFDMAVKRENDNKRNTLLCQRIQEIENHQA